MCSSFAEVPERVKARFITKRVNACGIYAISLFVNGQEHAVVVDDHFVINDYGSPKFAQMLRGKLWVMLLEKAWAKLHGSYWRTDGGYPTHAFLHLSGKPAYSLDNKKEDTEDLWNRIVACDAKDYALMGSSNSHPDGDSAEIDGIVQGHAYALLSAHTIDDGTRLVKLRNPWGCGEWTGDWCDSSDCWTDELKEQLGWSEKDDGIFFMTYDDYRSHFDVTDFAMLLREKPPVQQQIMR